MGTLTIRAFITRSANCFEIRKLDCRVILTEYISRLHCIHILQILCYALVHAIDLVVLGQFSYIIPVLAEILSY